MMDSFCLSIQFFSALLPKSYRKNQANMNSIFPRMVASSNKALILASFLFTRASALFLILLLLTSCGVSPDTEHSMRYELLFDEENISLGETPDHSCSYFYFLLAKNAENKKQYSEAQQAYEKALICDPDSSYILGKLPIILIKMGKYKGAAKWLREMIAKTPDDTSNRQLLAQLDVRNGETEEAIQLYNELIALQPENETNFLRLGVIFSKQHRYSDAETSFKSGIALNNDSFFAHLYLARLALQTGDFDSAENWYHEALQINWSAEIATEIAEFYGATGSPEKAEPLFRAILEKHPYDEKAGLGLVQTLLHQKMEKQALQVLDELQTHSEQPDRIILITCRIYLRSGEFDKAAELLKEIIENNEAAYMLAVIYYEKKDIEKALQSLLHIPPGSDRYQDSIILQVRIFMDKNQEDLAISLLHTVVASETDSTPALYALLASLYMEQKQIQDSYKTLDTGLEMFPDSKQLYYEYGLLLEQDGKQNQAIKSMERVLELQPEHAEALNYLGYTWANNNMNLDKALEYILLSNSLKPGNGYIQDSLGWVYFRRGELGEAITEILTAIQLEPEDPHIREHLGDIYKAQGKEKEALEAYRLAAEQFLKQGEKNRILDKIKAIEDR